jgi:two-component system sensor kinase FixL
MTHQEHPRRSSTSALLPFATAAFAAGVFIADTVTPIEIAVPVLYVAVVLMAARFRRARGIVLVAVGCVGLTVLSFLLSPSRGAIAEGLIDMTISIAAIGLTTVLALHSQWAEATLSEQASLLDLTHDVVISCTMDDVITYWNRGAEQLYGWHRGQAIGKISRELLGTMSTVPLDQITAELLRVGRWEGEFVNKRRDGTPVLVTNRCSLQRDERGQPSMILVTSNDITDRKRAEEALQQAEADLARLNRAMLLGEMTASIAHEVNQPIAAVIANANAGLRWLGTREPDFDEVRQALGRIVRDGTRAGEVIGRIRALVRNVPPHRDLLGIDQVISEVLALTQTEIQRNGVRLRRRLADDLPLVSADRIQLQQVMINLIVNAIEAMGGASERRRELAIVAGMNNAHEVFVEVQDTGPGLDLDKLDRLFQSFYTTKPDGIGMGLAISRSIVEAHGGRLSSAANQPHGAVFRFTLPVGQTQSASVE